MPTETSMMANGFKELRMEEAFILNLALVHTIADNGKMVNAMVTESWNSQITNFIKEHLWNQLSKVMGFKSLPIRTSIKDNIKKVNSMAKANIAGQMGHLMREIS